jgi:hypothetical protein
MSQSPPPAPNTLKAIAIEEAARRKGLYDLALKLFEPVIDLIRSAHEQGLEVKLDLSPPATRGSTRIFGTLHCRPFHAGGGEGPRDYELSIDPTAGTCRVTTTIDMSDEAQQEYFDEYRESPEPEWTYLYYRIPELRNDIEEALITALVELQGGPKTVHFGG